MMVVPVLGGAERLANIHKEACLVLAPSSPILKHTSQCTRNRLFVLFKSSPFLTSSLKTRFSLSFSFSVSVSTVFYLSVQVVHTPSPPLDLVIRGERTNHTPTPMTYSHQVRPLGLDIPGLLPALRHHRHLRSVFGVSLVFVGRHHHLRFWYHQTV
eukprot:m.54321 g.54321  ORF g.54321 m.54321 type:complete len:156 (-) comp7714_c2_seq4:970-1437(-)